MTLIFLNDAKGIFDQVDQTVKILNGSIIRIDFSVTPAANIAQNYKTAQIALDAGHLQKLAEGGYEVMSDIPSLSPSAASVIVTGKAGSGWDKWKLQSGDLLSTMRAGTRRRIGVPAAVTHTVSQSGFNQQIPPPSLPVNPNCSNLIEAIVRWIHQDPFPRNYSNRPNSSSSVGASMIKGWDERIKKYCYAKRKYEAFNHVHYFLDPIIDRLRQLVETVQDWNAVSKRGDIPSAAIEELELLSETIHLWGGVIPTGNSGHKDVWRVIKSAMLGQQMHHAPMSSGWTKVASLATVNHSNPQTIWDSRVSTSVIWRVDQILHTNKLQSSAFQCLDDLRVVGGKGKSGTRPRHLNNSWPLGPCTWPAHFAGSNIIKEIVNILNNPKNGYPRMPAPNQSPKDWDVFGVGLVLFMDGY